MAQMFADKSLEAEGNEGLTVKELIEFLSTLPDTAIIVCGEDSTLCKNVDFIESFNTVDFY